MNLTLNEINMHLDYTQILTAFVGIYEVVVRVFPTVKNYSLLTKVMNVIDLVVPNNIVKSSNDELDTNNKLNQAN